MKVYWTDKARTRLHGIHRYIAEESPLVAPEVIRRIVLQSSRLMLLPLSGRSVPEYERADIREILLRPYRIIYRVMPQRIDVLTVRHYRELLPEDLTGL